MLIKRKKEPAKGSWALPGAFVKHQEDFAEIARKTLQRETGASNIFLEQLKAYALTDTAPDNPLISIAYYSILKLDDFFTSEANKHIYKWASYSDLPTLPFDHRQKIDDAINKIRTEINIKPAIFELLPQQFSLNQLQKLYEQLLNAKLDNRNFRRKVKKLNYIVPLNIYETNVSRRPGLLYKFEKSIYMESMSFN